MTSFSKDEMVRIVLFYGKFENYQKVRNEYAKFYGISKHPRDLPDVRMFKSVIDRFLITISRHALHLTSRFSAALLTSSGGRLHRYVLTRSFTFSMPTGLTPCRQA